MNLLIINEGEVLFPYTLIHLPLQMNINLFTSPHYFSLALEYLIEQRKALRSKVILWLSSLLQHLSMKKKLLSNSLQIRNIVDVLLENMYSMDLFLNNLLLLLTNEHPHSIHLFQTPTHPHHQKTEVGNSADRVIIHKQLLNRQLSQHSQLVYMLQLAVRDV